MASKKATICYKLLHNNYKQSHALMLHFVYHYMYKHYSLKNASYIK
jgi:hypothetical protein